MQVVVAVGVSLPPATGDKRVAGSAGPHDPIRLISDMPADESYAAEAIASSLAWSAGSVSEIPVAMNLVRP